MARIDERLEIPSLDRDIPDDTWAYIDGGYTPLRDAKVSIATHALQYGTGVFEGIRAYWNAAEEQLYVFRLREHFVRMERSCRIMRIGLPGTADELSAIVLELLRRNRRQSDQYVRPFAYKAARSIKVMLHGIRDGFAVYTLPLGDYLPTAGATAITSSWHRISDAAIPPRAKISGSYVNTALAADLAAEAGVDEAIFLTADGQVSEGSSANIFMVRDGVLATPPVTADLLEGITRATVMTLAAELGIEVVERSIDRSELYVAEEVFFTGTGAQVAPCVEVDRRTVGDGGIGPIARRIGGAYFAIARGEDRRHPEWRTPVYA